MSTAPSLTKIQRNTLANLRTILRHIRHNFDSVSPYTNLVDNNFRSSTASSVSLPSSSSTSSSSSSSSSTAKDLNLFTQSILHEYRLSRTITDRSKLRIMRQTAANIALYLESVKTQKDLIHLLRGVDPDRPMQRKAAANFVGLELPKNKHTNEEGITIPLGRPMEQVTSIYRDALIQRTGDISRLTGIANIKAQYYGTENVLQNFDKKNSNSSNGTKNN